MALDTFNDFGDDTYEKPVSKVLAVHRDGTVSCYAQDLQCEEWSTQDSLIPKPALDIRVEHAVVVSLDRIRQTMLRSREDVLASLDLGEEKPVGSFLVLTTRSTPGEGHGGHSLLSLQILYIEPMALEARKVSTTTKTKVKELISLPIPEPQSFSSLSSNYSFHTATGTMYQSAGGKLAIYDFTGSILRLTHELNLGQDSRASYLRLSNNMLACSSLEFLSIVDLPYCSLQAHLELEEISESKSRVDDDSLEADFKFVSFHGPLNVAIALDGRKLLAIQMPMKNIHSNGNGKRTRDGLLVNAIGRGSFSTAKLPPTFILRRAPSLGKYLPQLAADNTWNDQLIQLDRYLSECDINGFEKTAASILDMEINEQEKRKRTSLYHAHLDQRKVNCILSRIFSVRGKRQKASGEASSARNELKIRLYPRRVCDALIENGVFDADHIQTALKCSGNLTCNSKIASGTFIRALAEWDTSLDILSSVLASAMPLSSAELVHVLALVSCSSVAAHSTETSKQLMIANREDSDDDVQMQLTHGDGTPDSHSPSPAFSGGDHNHRVLTLAMRRLYAIPSTSIARALSSELSVAQLRALVDEMRIQIARSGWLARYDDSLETMDPKLQDNHQICYIAHILNSAIDAIGTSGWILGRSPTDELAETSETISWLKAEISAALEGVQEATYLKGMLGETLLCGKDTLRSQVKTSKPNETYVTTLAPKPETIALEDVSNVLPLGLRLAPNVSISKVGAGGEIIKRSARDIGRQKSKMVGKYSFERIAI